MADIFSAEKRSAVMARIRSHGNRDTELKTITLLRSYRITGWRRNAKVFGRPDFIFPKQRIALFIDGCFWHRHLGCRLAYTPKSRPEFWLPKFDKNIARDRLVTRTLRRNGWTVIRVWECQLAPMTAAKTIRRIELELRASLKSLVQRRLRAEMFLAAGLRTDKKEEGRIKKGKPRDSGRSN